MEGISDAELLKMCQIMVEKWSLNTQFFYVTKVRLQQMGMPFDHDQGVKLLKDIYF